MIAPIRNFDSNTDTARRRLSRARRAAASTLFHVETAEKQQTAPMATWKAWLVSAWMVVVVVCYALHMARWW